MVENNISPEQVSPDDAARILDFVNKARTAEEIADSTDLPNERDVGVRVGQRILDRRAELGGFTNLQQLDDVEQVGPERFTEIVISLVGPRSRTVRTIDDVLTPEQKSQIEPLINEGLAEAREHASCSVADALVEDFIYLYVHRNEESREIRLITENFVQLYNQTVDLFIAHGVEDVMKQLVPIFRDIKLSRHLCELRREQEMFARAGVSPEVIREFGRFLDYRLPLTITTIERGQFSLSSLKLPDGCGYLGPHEGNSWAGFRSFLSGAVFVADIVCATPTAGVAALSIIVGGSVGAYEIIN